MANVYVVMTDGANDGTATGTQGKYTDEEWATIGADSIANAASNDWAGKGLTLTQYYYATITLALAAGANAGAGDRIMCAHTHALSTSSAITYAGPATASSMVRVISVNAADVSLYLKGAKESQTGTTADISYTGQIRFTGLTLQAADRHQPGLDSFIIVEDGNWDTLKTSGAAFIYPWNYAAHTRLIDTDMDWGSVDGQLFPFNGWHFEWWGGSLTGNSTGDGLLNQFIGGNTNAGGVIDVRGVDLSSIDGYIIKLTGGGYIDDNMIATFDLCTVNSGLTAYVQERGVLANNRYTFTRCSSHATEAEYQYYYESRGGKVEEETSIIRTATTAFEETDQKISYKIVTTAAADPFVWEFPTRYAELATAATDTLTIYLLGPAGLTDLEVYATAMYPKTADTKVPIYASSSANLVTGSGQVVNPLATGTALTAGDLGHWENETGVSAYTIAIPCTAAAFTAGVDCVPEITLYIDGNAGTFYFCPTVELS